MIETMTLQLTMTYITFTGWLSYAGCYAASLSSAIASLIGAPRILQVILRTLRLFSNVTQAVGKDGIYPGVGWFEKGGNANNDPIRGEVVFASLSQMYYLLNRVSARAVVNILSFDLDLHSGYFLCFAVAMGFVMIANLNAIGIVASNFFLAR